MNFQPIRPEKPVPVGPKHGAVRLHETEVVGEHRVFGRKFQKVPQTFCAKCGMGVWIDTSFLKEHQKAHRYLPEPKTTVRVIR